MCVRTGFFLFQFQPRLYFDNTRYQSECETNLPRKILKESDEEPTLLFLEHSHLLRDCTRGGEGGGQIKIQNLTLIGLVQLNI